MRGWKPARILYLVLAIMLTFSAIPFIPFSINMTLARQGVFSTFNVIFLMYDAIGLLISLTILARVRRDGYSSIGALLGFVTYSLALVGHFLFYRYQQETLYFSDFFQSPAAEELFRFIVIVAVLTWIFNIMALIMCYVEVFDLRAALRPRRKKSTARKAAAVAGATGTQAIVDDTAEYHTAKIRQTPAKERTAELERKKKMKEARRGETTKAKAQTAEIKEVPPKATTKTTETKKQTAELHAKETTKKTASKAGARASNYKDDVKGPQHHKAEDSRSAAQRQKLEESRNAAAKRKKEAKEAELLKQKEKVSDYKNIMPAAAAGAAAGAATASAKQGTKNARKNGRRAGYEDTDVYRTGDDGYGDTSDRVIHAHLGEERRGRDGQRVIIVEPYDHDDVNNDGHRRVRVKAEDTGTVRGGRRGRSAYEDDSIDVIIEGVKLSQIGLTAEEDIIDDVNDEFRQSQGYADGQGRGSVRQQRERDSYGTYGEDGYVAQLTGEIFMDEEALKKKRRRRGRRNAGRTEEERTVITAEIIDHLDDDD